MGLSAPGFDKFAKGSMHAVRMVENLVVWIPYGWVTMMVNCTKEIPMALVIPYLNAKLALGYPSIGLLVNFHLENVKANQRKGGTYWTEHGDSFIEWLGNLNAQEDIQVAQVANRGTPPEPRALEDGRVEDPDSLLEEAEAASFVNQLINP